MAYVALGAHGHLFLLARWVVTSFWGGSHRPSLAFSLWPFLGFSVFDMRSFLLAQ